MKCFFKHLQLFALLINTYCRLSYFYQDPLLRCIDDRLTPFYHQFAEYDAHIQHRSPLSPPFINEKENIPYVGNGIFALEIHENAHLNIKSGRALTQPLYFHPIVSIATDKKSFKESAVIEYSTGIVHRYGRLN